MPPQQTRVSAADRRAARELRLERHWAVKYAAAKTPGQLAEVEFDRVRASLTRLAKRDPDAARRAWNDLFALLKGVRESRAVTARHGTGQARR
jgi:hypothetical protein